MAYNNYGNRYQQTTPIVLNLIIINVVVFLAQMLTTGNNDPNPLTDLLALHHYKSPYFRPFQVITYMFMHANFLHILFNMFALWMFGSMVERYWGPKRFLLFYFICGVGSALFQMGSYIHEFWPYEHSLLTPETMQEYEIGLRAAATVGASGAIMGVLAAFGYLFPNMELLIIPIPIPIKAKWAITAMILFDVFGGVVKRQGDNVAHWAHIGGALIGFMLVLYWSKKNKETFY